MQKLIFLLLIVFSFSCKENELTNNDIITISVTLPPYADFVSNLIGTKLNDKIRINTLIKPGTNAHSYEPNPVDIKNLLNSKLYFRVGDVFQLEESLFEKINFDENSTNIIDCSNNVELIEHNPHYWLSPANVKIIAQNILEALIYIMPEHANYFTNNRNMFISKIDSISNDLKEFLDNKENRLLFVYHPAWTYFAKDFNLTEISIESEGKSPNALELSNLIHLAKQKNIKTIFFDPHFDNSAAQTIAKSLNIKLISLDPLPSDYVKNFIDISEKLKNSLI